MRVYGICGRYQAIDEMAGQQSSHLKFTGIEF